MIESYSNWKIRDRFIFINADASDQPMLPRLTEMTRYFVSKGNTVCVGTCYAPIEESGTDDAGKSSPLLNELATNLSEPGLQIAHYFSAHYRIMACGPMAHSFSRDIPVSSFSTGSVAHTLFGKKPLVIVTHDLFLSELPITKMIEEAHESRWTYWHKTEGTILIEGTQQERSFFSKRYKADVSATTRLSHILPGGIVKELGAGENKLFYFESEEFFQTFSERIAGGFHIEKTSSTFPVSGTPGTPFLRVDHIGIVSRYHQRISKFLELFSGELLYEGIVPQIGVNCQYFDAGNIELELVTPVEENSIVSNHFREASKHPIHHIAFEVSDLDAAVTYLKDKGYYPIRDDTYLAPKPYHQVIFLSPVHTWGLLIELVCDSGKNLPQYGAEELPGH